MQFEGTEIFNTPREKLWQFLTDPHAVGNCMPGLKSLDVTVPNQKFHAVAAIGLGNMRAIFSLDVEWVDLVAPESARVKVHGTAPGSAVDASGEMRLSNGGEGATHLDWSGDVVVVGTIASLTARLMGIAAKKIIGQFFNCIKKEVEV